MRKPMLPRAFGLWDEKMQISWLKQNRPDLYEEYMDIMNKAMSEVPTERAIEKKLIGRKRRGP